MAEDPRTWDQLTLAVARLDLNDIDAAWDHLVDQGMVHPRADGPEMLRRIVDDVRNLPAMPGPTSTSSIATGLHQAGVTTHVARQPVDDGQDAPDAPAPAPDRGRALLSMASSLLLLVGILGTIVSFLLLIGGALFRIHEANHTDWGDLAEVAVPGTVRFTADAEPVHLTYIDGTERGEAGVGDIPTVLRAPDGSEVSTSPPSFERRLYGAWGVFGRTTYVFYGAADLPAEGEYELAVERPELSGPLEPTVHVGTTPPPSPGLPALGWLYTCLAAAAIGIGLGAVAGRGTRPDRAGHAPTDPSI